MKKGSLLWRLGGDCACYLCEKEFTLPELTREHKIPRSRGGTSDLENLALACNWCNVRKGPLTEAEYRSVMGDNKARKLLIAQIMGQK